MSKLNNELSQKQLEETLLIGEMKELKKKLEKEKIIFNVKTGETDKMFGQISVKQIKKELEKLGYNIDKTKILLDHPIMSLGDHFVEIELHKQVKAKIKIHVSKGK
jgi:large subunit ribosomal protein L9